LHVTVCDALLLHLSLLSTQSNIFDSIRQNMNCDEEEDVRGHFLYIR
jgi:hypothetical protein